MKTKKVIKSDGSSQLLVLRNRARGAIAKLMSNHIGKKSSENWRYSQKGNEQLNKVLADAKGKLSQSELGDFEAWIDTLLSGSSHESKIGTSSSTLGALPSDIPNEKLQTTLIQAYEALHRVSKTIKAFLMEAAKLSEIISRQEWQEAKDKLTEIENKFGVSYWSIETRIAILNILGESSEITDFINRLSIKSLGLNRFFYYHFRLRSESSQSTSRFKVYVGRRLSNLSKTYKAYAMFRLTHLIPSDAKEISAILGYEHLTTRIDLLFTSIKTSIYIIENPNVFHESEITLANNIIVDFASPLLDPIITVNENKTVALKVSSHLRGIISASIQKAFRGSINQDPFEKYFNFYTNCFSALVTHDPNESEEESFYKYCMNFSWDPYVILFNVSPKVPKICDLFAYRSDVKTPDFRINVLMSAWLEQLEKYLSDSTRDDEKLLLSRKHLTEEFSLIKDSFWFWEGMQISSTVMDSIIVDSSYSNFEDGNYDKAVAISAHGMVKNPRIATSLPLKELFESKEWADVAMYGISPELCCCLHTYLELCNERQIRTFKGFAIEELMYERGHETITSYCDELISSSLGRPLQEQFLVSVCDLPTLELLPCGYTSRNALENRRKLLIKASTISDASSERFLDEAEAIKSQLEIDNVLNVLDESLVYVDEDPLVALCAREFSSDFDRYKFLRKSDKTDISSLEELMNNLNQQSAVLFTIPKSELDDLIQQMLIGVKEMFMNNSINGLDAIIGRRIRHGTISDELRGTLEHLQLIGQRPRAGADYELPNSIAALISKLDVSARKHVSRSFKKFFQSIDNLIIQLRDEVFQCTQAEGKLDAAFRMDINPVMYALARNLGRDAENIEQLVRIWFQVFWLALSQTVDLKRKLYAEFIKLHLRGAFEDLLKDIQRAGLFEANFIATIQKASEQLQHKATVIGGWIKIPRVNYEGITYPLALVFDAVVAMVRAKRPGFYPELTNEIEPNIQLDAHLFPVVNDALKIALVNISEHSGVRRNVSVSVSIRLSDSKNKLCFEILSEIAKNSWTKEKAAKLDTIQSDIDKSCFVERALLSKESGISKIAAIVSQQTDCRIEFGPVDKKRKFRLYFELNYVEENNPAPLAVSKMEEVALDAH